MNDYTKTDFYHYFDKETNVRRYHIKVNGTFIEVSKEVYYVIYNSYRKQLRDNRKDQDYGLVSFDKLLPDGHGLLDKYGKTDKYLETLHKNDFLILTMNLINVLEDKDRELITELLIKNKKESELAKRYHVSQQTINKRKIKILNMLRKELTEVKKKI